MVLHQGIGPDGEATFRISSRMKRASVRVLPQFEGYEQAWVPEKLDGDTINLEFTPLASDNGTHRLHHPPVNSWEKHERFSMGREGRRLSLLIAPWFVLVLQVSGQGTEPTLQDTMNFIANALTSGKTISWTETIPDVFGASYTMSSSVTDVNTDSSACSLKWTSVYTSSDGEKLLESYLVNLRTISNVVVEPYSQYRKSDFQFKFEVSPETYVLVMQSDTPLAGNRELYRKNKFKSRTKLARDREARIVFSNEQTANTVRNRILQAVKTCGTKRSGP